MTTRTRVLFVGASFVLPLALLTPAAVSAAPADPVLTVLSERPLPKSYFADVRWSGDQTLLLAAAKGGVSELDLGGSLAPRMVLPAGNGRDQVWLATHLGVSERYLAIAAPAFSYGWLERRRATQIEVRALEMTVDLDLSGDRLLLLGGEKKGDEMAPDGAIAWLGSLTSDLADLRPVHLSSEGRGVPRMNDCSQLGLGAVRFLGDGSFIIVPGVEPGVFWYDAQGRLLRTWTNEELGLDDGCPPPGKQRDSVRQFPEPRFAWLNQNRLLDDVLPLPQGPGLLVRAHTGGTTRWRLLVLARDDSFRTWEVPITSTTGLSHLRGDVRGDRIALLVSEHGKEGPAAAPRLTLVRVPRP